MSHAVARLTPSLQIDIYATKGNEYKFLFMAKGGGSANKTYLFQQTKALLNPDSLMKFLDTNVCFCVEVGSCACCLLNSEAFYYFPSI